MIWMYLTWWIGCIWWWWFSILILILTCTGGSRCRRRCDWSWKEWVEDINNVAMCVKIRSTYRKLFVRQASRKNIFKTWKNSRARVLILCPNECVDIVFMVTYKLREFVLGVIRELSNFSLMMFLNRNWFFFISVSCHFVLVIIFV